MRKYIVFLASLFILSSCTKEENGIGEELSPSKECKLDKFEFLKSEGSERKEIKEVCFRGTAVTNPTDVAASCTRPPFEAVLKNESVFKIETDIPAGLVIPNNIYVSEDEENDPRKEQFSLIPHYTEITFKFEDGEVEVPPHSGFKFEYAVKGYKFLKPFRITFVETYSGDIVELKGQWSKVKYETKLEDENFYSLSE